MAVFFGSFGTNGRVLEDLSRGISSLAGKDEVCGLAITDGERIEVMTHSELLESRQGNLTGGQEIAGIGVADSVVSQPKMFSSSRHGDYAVAHNGRIMNSSTVVWECLPGDEIWELDDDGGITSGKRDVEIVSAIAEQKDNLPDGISQAMVKVAGDCNCVFLTPEGLHVSSSMGLTRLAIGEKDGTLAVSNDPRALCNGSGFKYICDVPPGVVMRINKDGLETVSGPSVAKNSVKRCWSKWILDSNLDSLLGNIPVIKSKMWLGARLAELDRADDLVFSPQDSTVGSSPNHGENHALGYASAMGIPYSILFKNLESESEEHKIGGLSPIQENIRDKKVVTLVLSVSSDLPKMVEMLFDCRAQEVHIRVVTPNMLRPCPFDFPGVGEEISFNPLSDQAIESTLGATSVRFLKLPKDGEYAEGVFPKSRLCQQCFDTYESKVLSFKA